MDEMASILTRRREQKSPEQATSTPRGGARSALRILERVLFGVGLVCVAVYVSACAQRSFFQRHHDRTFDAAIAEAMQLEQHDLEEWSAKRVARFEGSREQAVTPLGRLEIPAADISVMVLDGTSEKTLDRAVGRIEGTAEPGTPGNLGIAGHRDGIFRGLRTLAVGDELTFATLEGVSRYEIEEISIVEPEDVEVLDVTERQAVTLVTCYPFYYVGSAPQRYVVRAYTVDFEPWSQESLSRYSARKDSLAALQ